MTLTIERTPLTLKVDGREVQVEKLGIRLPFGRKPTDLTDIAASGDDAVSLSLNRSRSSAQSGTTLANNSYRATFRPNLQNFFVSSRLTRVFCLLKTGSNFFDSGTRQINDLARNWLLRIPTRLPLSNKQKSTQLINSRIRQAHSQNSVCDLHALID